MLLLSAQRRRDMTESLPPELTVTRCFASADVRTAWLDHSTNLHLYILMLGPKTHSHPPTSGSFTERVKFFYLLKPKKKQQRKKTKVKGIKRKKKADKASALAVSHCFSVDGTSDFQEKKKNVASGLSKAKATRKVIYFAPASTYE